MNERRDFIVKELADNCDLPGEHQDEIKVTMRFFWDGAALNEATPELAKGLDHISDVLSHGKKPWRRYTPDWKVVRGSGSLEPEEWPLVAATLLKYSDLADKSTAKGRGRAFDWLNAALTTLDLMKEESLENPFEEELIDWSKELVGSIASKIEVAS